MKAISIVIRIIAIAGAAAAVYFYFDLGDQLEETRQELGNTERTLSQTQSNLRETEEERDGLVENVAELESNLEEAESQIAVQLARIEEIESELEETKGELESAQADAENYRDDASRYLDELVDLRARVDDLDPDDVDEGILRDQQREIRRLRQERDEALARIEELSPAEDAEEERVRELDTIRGKVTDIGAHRAFVVVDLGSQHNIIEGDELLVHRDGNYLARVRVSRVEEAESVAQVLPGSTESRLRTGDDVRISKPKIN
jgi:DNA repair exonuclease SbcCD ATPase subunit